MAKRTNRTKIYGLTIKQWTILAVLIIAVVGFGCSFCYNFIRNRISPANETANQTQPAPNANRKQKRQPSSASTLNTEQAAERYLKFGNPGNAAQSDANNFLMVNSQFALSYNRQRGTANWVAWTLTEADMGDVDRANDFRPDDRLPKGFYRVANNDYTGSGFDRGHLAPSADRTATREANSATFLMTNIAPQTGDLNRGVWERLESETRKIARQGNDLYIIAGVSGETGRIKNKISIPASYWKVIVVLPDGIDEVSSVNENARIIAVEMPNTNGIKNDDWRKYRTTVRNIEQKTGLNLLSNLPPNVQNVLETKMDSQ